MTKMTKHVVAETNYCSVMYERPHHQGGILAGRPRCTAAGRYMDTEGRVICARCAAGRLVTKLTDIPAVLDLVDQLVDARIELTAELRARLRALVAIAPENAL